VAGELHGNTARNTGPFEVPYGRPPEQPLTDNAAPFLDGCRAPSLLFQQFTQLGKLAEWRTASNCSRSKNPVRTLCSVSIGICGRNSSLFAFTASENMRLSTASSRLISADGGSLDQCRRRARSSQVSNIEQTAHASILYCRA
jgi:hypothetical protein